MSRLDSLIRRMETVETDLAHAATSFTDAGSLIIANQILIGALLAELDANALERVRRQCQGEVERQKAMGFTQTLRATGDADIVMKSSMLLDAAGGNIDRQFEREKRRRGGG